MALLISLKSSLCHDPIFLVDEICSLAHVFRLRLGIISETLCSADSPIAFSPSNPPPMLNIMFMSSLCNFCRYKLDHSTFEESIIALFPDIIEITSILTHRMQLWFDECDKMPLESTDSEDTKIFGISPPLHTLPRSTYNFGFPIHLSIPPLISEFSLNPSVMMYITSDMGYYVSKFMHELAFKVHHLENDSSSTQLSLSMASKFTLKDDPSIINHCVQFITHTKSCMYLECSNIPHKRQMDGMISFLSFVDACSLLAFELGTKITELGAIIFYPQRFLKLDPHLHVAAKLESLDKSSSAAPILEWTVNMVEHLCHLLSPTSPLESSLTRAFYTKILETLLRIFHHLVHGSKDRSELSVKLLFPLLEQHSNVLTHVDQTSGFVSIVEFAIKDEYNSSKSKYLIEHPAKEKYVVKILSKCFIPWFDGMTTHQRHDAFSYIKRFCCSTHFSPVMMDYGHDKSLVAYFIQCAQYIDFSKESILGIKMLDVIKMVETFVLTSVGEFKISEGSFQIVRKDLTPKEIFQRFRPSIEIYIEHVISTKSESKIMQPIVEETSEIFQFLFFNLLGHAFAKCDPLSCLDLMLSPEIVLLEYQSHDISLTFEILQNCLSCVNAWILKMNTDLSNKIFDFIRHQFDKFIDSHLLSSSKEGHPEEGDKSLISESSSDIVPPSPALDNSSKSSESEPLFLNSFFKINSFPQPLLKQFLCFFSSLFSRFSISLCNPFPRPSKKYTYRFSYFGPHKSNSLYGLQYMCVITMLKIFSAILPFCSFSMINECVSFVRDHCVVKRWKGSRELRKRYEDVKKKFHYIPQFLKLHYAYLNVHLSTNHFPLFPTSSLEGFPHRKIIELWLCPYGSLIENGLFSSGSDGILSKSSLIQSIGEERGDFIEHVKLICSILQKIEEDPDIKHSMEGVDGVYQNIYSPILIEDCNLAHFLTCCIHELMTSSGGIVESCFVPSSCHLISNFDKLGIFHPFAYQIIKRTSNQLKFQK
ncbi:hypothetical protein ADUPG1_000406 [Aduncisulcus paluster]|uniref:Uncharacterized protein n=1 Tax=Aduncisulcus paluster TaxID=2918883 RepID=A0ABQ5K668_9EUKA|nr:hypothetical protein ADUPG1_000406 [Aduncisulcus paluster]